MKKQHFLFFVALIFIACGGDLETVETREDDGTIIKYVRKKSNFAKEGTYTITDSEGILMEEAQYANDTLHGKRKLFYESGELNIIEHYNHGIFEGDYKIFFKNGKVKFEGVYQDGILRGETKSYYESGELKEMVMFENNEENGPFEEFHKNGKLKARGNYLNGDNEHGLLELFDENGEVIKKMNCEHGVCRTTWTSEDGDVNSKKI